MTVAGLATGIASGLGPLAVVAAFGKAFITSRYVAVVWLVLPVIFYCVLYMLNRKYAEVLIKTNEGFYVLCVAVFFQILGLISIKKIVSVKM